ncbi:hypothetical protein [Rhodanobacter glycinis]|nr:hypothetical protein [Rhodanobacter glycinis]
MRHQLQRQPKKTAGFSWGRFVAPDGSVIYRLFRRDQRGALHYFMRVYTAEELNADPRIRVRIAHEIHRARHALRDQVDDVDLALMGVTQ